MLINFHYPYSLHDEEKWGSFECGRHQPFLILVQIYFTSRDVKVNFFDLEHVFWLVDRDCAIFSAVFTSTRPIADNTIPEEWSDDDKRVKDWEPDCWCKGVENDKKTRESDRMIVVSWTSDKSRVPVNLGERWLMAGCVKTIMTKKEPKQKCWKRWLDAGNYK